jgi:glutamyl-tRNA(Gln) amidotransferase subunit E
MKNGNSFESLGFRSGLEIHHQLATRHKLFCRCPTGLVDRPADARIVRHMRPTLSELGEYDRTALMEFKTRKNVTYELFRDRVCTYEMDDTPPFPMNEEALDIAIEVALLLNCSIVDEIHVSRKQYLDGSIPTGFQRTAVIGVNGWVPYRDRRISITHLTVEEDACREMGDSGHDIVFRTDRLSTPLIEVITGPDMRTPGEVAEVDALLGRIIRSTGKVRRGIGSVRQDVNVSIEGGVRVEIKGVPRTGLIPALTGSEAQRQKALLDIMAELRVRGVTTKNLETEKKDVTTLLLGTRCAPIRRALTEGGEVGAIVLRGFGGGLLNTPVLPGLMLADEFAGRVRVIACLDRMPNMFHSDSSPPGGP